MPYTYAIPDLHGRADLLEIACERILDHAGGIPGTIVCLGDYVDKGPDSRQVIDRLITGVGEGWRLVCLKGNHDAMMLAAIKNPDAVADWLSKGGDAALASYGITSAPWAKDAIPLAHKAWLKGLEPIHVDRHRIFVHAGLDARVGLKKQVEKTLFWKRYKSGEQANGFRGRHVVHGHDSSASNPLMLPGRTNLDTLAWRTGRLIVAVYDDEMPGGAVAYLQATGIPQNSSRASEDPVQTLRADQPASRISWWRRLARLFGLSP